MREKKVTRVFCEFCSKGGFKRPAMEKHESACTKNPKRVCRICKRLGVKQVPIENLTNYAKGLPVGDEGCEDSVDRLREFCQGCPACMLASIRQSNATIVIDYKQEFERYQAEELALQKEADEMATYQ